MKKTKPLTVKQQIEVLALKQVIYSIQYKQ